MHLFDASSIIHAWDNYPVENFPPLWNWLAERIDHGEFGIPSVAFEEVKKKAPECAKWLEENAITKHPLTGEILTEAFRIKNLLGIEEDNYHPKGVGENDLIIIATARIADATLVSEEGRQFGNQRSEKNIKFLLSVN